MEKTMSLKKLFNSLFAYQPPVDYNFSLPEERRNGIL